MNVLLINVLASSSIGQSQYLFLHLILLSFNLKFDTRENQRICDKRLYKRDLRNAKTATRRLSASITAWQSTLDPFSSIKSKFKQ